ncbi:MAG: right-handed parallel beta-helix repeat-containing protein [Planctomycetaceae bacterium]|nr:right-handed parallel beta-helix repeat-containing protein [Planctomycetaceae bacterium]
MMASATNESTRSGRQGCCNLLVELRVGMAAFLSSGEWPRPGYVPFRIGPVHHRGCMTSTVISFCLSMLIVCGCDAAHGTSGMNAVTYYIDASQGADDNAGTSPETPWKTLARVNAERLRGGDTVLFKRGEHWPDHLIIAAAPRSQSKQAVSIGVYGDGDAPAPVIAMVTIRREKTILDSLTIDQGKHERPLFRMELKHRTTLVDRQPIAASLREEFARQGIDLSSRSVIHSEPGAVQSVVRDPDQQRQFTLSPGEDSLLVFEKGDALRVRGARNCVLRSITLCNGTSDGIDADQADGLLIDSCLIHHFLAGSFTEQHDAHGIVVTRTRGVTVRDTEIHHVSGDCFQTDPYRADPLTNDVLIENCHFWTGPLEQDFNEHWRAGERPGENAIDTKAARDWERADRLRITVRNTVAQGWQKDAYIHDKAAFNMKEKIDALFDGVTVSDCENAFRLRGTRGNAKVTIVNAVIYDCDVAIRAEDNLRDLRVFHTTFGSGIGRLFRDAAMDKQDSAKSTWELRNNLFIRRPMPRTDRINTSAAATQSVVDSRTGVLTLEATNRLADAADFIDAAAHDYRLALQSRLIDTVTSIDLALTDRHGVHRPAAEAADPGAHEHVTAPRQ